MYANLFWSFFLGWSSYHVILIWRVLFPKSCTRRNAAAYPKLSHGMGWDDPKIGRMIRLHRLLVIVAGCSLLLMAFHLFFGTIYTGSARPPDTILYQSPLALALLPRHATLTACLDGPLNATGVGHSMAKIPLVNLFDFCRDLFSSVGLTLSKIKSLLAPGCAKSGPKRPRA